MFLSLHSYFVLPFAIKLYLARLSLVNFCTLSCPKAPLDSKGTQWEALHLLVLFWKAKRHHDELSGTSTGMEDLLIPKPPILSKKVVELGDYVSCFPFLPSLILQYT